MLYGLCVTQHCPRILIGDERREPKQLPLKLKTQHPWLQVCSLLGRQSWLAVSQQKEENGAGQTLLYLQWKNDISVHGAGRAMTGKIKVFPEAQGKPSTCVHGRPEGHVQMSVCCSPRWLFHLQEQNPPNQIREMWNLHLLIAGDKGLSG